jgi:hypothetical protein
MSDIDIDAELNEMKRLWESSMDLPQCLAVGPENVQERVDLKGRERGIEGK